MEKLTGTLVYIQVQKPTKCFVETKGSEWKASVVVDEDTADLWDEKFPKQPAKQLKTTEFKNVYKVDAPYPEQKKQYIITVRKNTVLANGDPVPMKYTPKVYQRKGDILLDITQSILPANGSKGTISIESYEGKMGVFARLKNIMVVDLIEYEGASGGDAGSEFGIPVAKDQPDETPTKEVVKESPKKTSKAKVEVSEDELEDDLLPF